jgi:hypothetical protein
MEVGGARLQLLCFGSFSHLLFWVVCDGWLGRCHGHYQDLGSQCPCRFSHAGHRENAAAAAAQASVVAPFERI